MLSTVSQLGRVAVFTCTNRAGTVDETTTFAMPATPELFTYESETVGAEGTGVTVRTLGETMVKETGISLSPAGPFCRWRLKLCVVPTPKPPHGVPVPVAWMVKVVAVPFAVPVSVVGDRVTQVGSFPELVSSVKGVPPVAAEVTEIVWAGERNVNEPGEPGVKVQLRAIEVGETVSPDVVAV